MIGVSGSGKSEVGQEVARKLGLEFFDADDFHSAANKDKMHRGIPLTDDDRRDWLQALHELLRKKLDAGELCVLACSALKRVYRERLRAGLKGVYFFYLKVDHDVVAGRLQLRKAHFFAKELLDTQFAILEEPGPDEAFIVDQNRPLEDAVRQILEYAAQVGLKPV